MDPRRFTQIDATTWRIEPTGAMRVPAVIYADEDLIRGMDDKVGVQACNVATLPGIVTASYAMPDAHWGYGFPIGGVAAFDPDGGGIVSAGGVGFDISCGVRTMLTDLAVADIEPVQSRLADALFREIPAGVGSRGAITLDTVEMDRMLTGGARWAVENGWGESRDLERIEEGGAVPGARPDCVSERAKGRQRHEMGTLGSGNHYLEVQAVAEIVDRDAARAFGLAQDQVVVTIHCGSRGLGHQIGTEYLAGMPVAAAAAGIALPDRELACAPINSDIGQRYLGAMRAASNCALANREILGHYARRILRDFFPEVAVDLLFDVSHNTCKAETHTVDGEPREVYVHRKGATRAFGPGHPSLPDALRAAGQPVLIGGSMGTGSYILAGLASSEEKAFGSACHGAGRALSRHAALRQWSGRGIVDELAARGILVCSPSARGVAEEAPGAYKDVGAVVLAAERAGLARRVARLRPLICIKG
ncbi:RtcB family protein [Chelatococcus sp. SYSU_G07232]|uniref:tRNA-splicing ligase RtcB n=1 Tax=Chelatococcus albus TaxID=3047466 RepID=A0ABT7AFB7_9HYPH|nr:RtcB family protein [Chelatococcus sp. SYSU_G07232]MDJ1158073.1 RtcB family protein [Chelatococcus sp. SYSU_G07232]